MSILTLLCREQSLGFRGTRAVRRGAQGSFSGIARQTIKKDHHGPKT